MKSRFDDRAYENLFAETSGQYGRMDARCYRRDRISKLRSEVRLWYRRNPFKLLAVLLAGCVVFGVLLLGLIAPSVGKRPLGEDILAGVAILLILLLIVLLVVAMAIVSVRNSLLATRFRKRDAIGQNEFIQRVPGLLVYSEYVREIRNALGSAYGTGPETIAPEDNAETLKYLAFSKSSSCPFIFEIIVGAARRLMIQADDENVDRVVEKVQGEAESVSDLVLILCKELSGLEQCMIRPAESVTGDPASMVQSATPVPDEGAGAEDEGVGGSLKLMVPSSPIMKYLGCVIQEAGLGGVGAERMYRSSELLPRLPGYDEKIVPSFGEFLRVLNKEFCLGQTFSPVPQRGVLELAKDGRTLFLHFEFLARRDTGYVKIRVDDTI